jgi:GNAT superfamily N-acetyltransferase
MDIAPFGPDDATEVAAWADLLNAVHAVDSPWRDPATPETVAGELRYGWDLEPGTPYLARAGGEVVGGGVVHTGEWDNRHLAWFGLHVLPDHRRRGYGSEILRFLEAEGARRGRTLFGMGAGESAALTGFAALHGYDEALVEVIRRQYLAEIDRPALDAAYDDALPHASDYVVERRTFPTPDGELPQVAELTAAINDAPTGDLAIEDEVFPPERIRAYETAQLGLGRRPYRVVARHRASGELAGHSVVVVESDRPALAEQHDTAVAPAHRGHRIGLLLKVEMLRWLSEAEPQIDHIDTGNAESNAHMIGVNELLGYRIMERTVCYQRKL